MAVEALLIGIVHVVARQRASRADAVLVALPAVLLSLNKVRDEAGQGASILVADQAVLVAPPQVIAGQLRSAVDTRLVTGQAVLELARFPIDFRSRMGNRRLGPGASHPDK